MKFTQVKKLDTRICEVCGTEFVLGYGYSIAATWLVTGHAHVAAFDCANGQHWGCTPKHAMQALAECLAHDEHLSIAQLLKRHNDAEEDGKAKISVEDEEWVKQYPQFPIISVREVQDGNNTDTV